MATVHEPELKEGDLLDIEGYRGQGLYYYDGSQLIKTLGTYGYFLPSEAWKFVELNGVEFYEGCGAEYVLFPKDAKVSVSSGVLHEPLRHLKHPGRFGLALNLVGGIGEYVIVNGKKFENPIEEFF